MKNDKEGMIFCFGIISLVASLIGSGNTVTFLVFACIAAICFYNCRRIIFQMFSKPIIRRIVKLRIKERELSAKLEEKNLDKNTVENYILSNKDIVKEINNYKIQINNLSAKKNKLDKEIVILDSKKENLEKFIRQENIIKNAIESENKLYEILTDKVSFLEKQKEKLQNELSDLRKQINPLQKRIEFSLNANLDYIDSLTGIEFEQYFSKLLFFLGYQSNCTNATADYGLDVIAIKDGIKYGFQCKLYSQNVGNDAVQEALSGKLYYNCHVAIVVTNNYFTHNAIKQAEKSNVVLWDRDKLEEILKQFDNEDIYIKN